MPYQHFFKARANAESGHDNFAGGKPTNTSLALAQLCYEILIRDGLKAKESAEKKEWSKELENIIEANIYLSGVGFESNGLACAHSIYNANHPPTMSSHVPWRTGRFWCHCSTGS